MAVILVASVLCYKHHLKDDLFAIISGAFATLAAVSGIFAAKPVDGSDVLGAVDKVL